MRLHSNFGNLTEVKADLMAISNGLERELTAGIRDDAQELIALTREYTPVGHGQGEWGHIRDSYSIAQGRGAISIVSSHPGAIVHEYGGNIAPHKNQAGTGGVIHIKQSHMAYKAGMQSLPVLEQLVIARIERLMAAHL